MTNNRHNKDHQVAIKVMNKSKLKGCVGRNHIEDILEEVQILITLDHPNIVKYYETYNDEKYIYLVMEYIGGGELFNKIITMKNYNFTEDVAKEYMSKLMGACNHMHS